MNFENYLSLKKALRIAMPCLALSLFVSCSNEETTGASNETTLPATNLTLTATVPVAKENSSTRVGIKDDASDATNYVWIEGETLTLYWKNLHDSEEDKVIVYKVEGVSADGKSCVMNPVESTTLENGFYKIHSLSPHTEFNFVNGELSATIDLGNQNQPSDAVDHNYLSDKLYQYATTVVQVYEGAIISGTTNLPFEFITSLLRVRVVNNTGLPIDVKKVKLSYSTENNPQFYSKGIFTANEFVGVHSYEVASDATLNDLSVTTSKVLNNNDKFDVYMSFFPTAGYGADANESLNMVIEFEVNGINSVFTRNVTVLNSAFRTGSSYLTFEARDLWLLTLTITVPDLPDGAIVTPADPLDVYDVHYNGYVYSVMRLNPSISSVVMFSGRPFVPAASRANACPSGWFPFVESMLSPNSLQNAALFAALGKNFAGYVVSSDGHYLISDDQIFYYSASEPLYPHFNNSGHTGYILLSGHHTLYYFRPFCRRVD